MNFRGIFSNMFAGRSNIVPSRRSKSSLELVSIPPLSLRLQPRQHRVQGLQRHLSLLSFALVSRLKAVHLIFLGKPEKNQHPTTPPPGFFRHLCVGSAPDPTQTTQPGRRVASSQSASGQVLGQSSCPLDCRCGVAWITQRPKACTRLAEDAETGSAHTKRDALVFFFDNQVFVLGAIAL